MKQLRYTVVLTGDLWATFADKFAALDFSDQLSKKRPGAFVETFDTKDGLTLIKKQRDGVQS